LKLTELTSYLDTWLGGKDTDDLTEGSVNLYDNRTFNQTLTDSLYSSGSDNSSWNETWADTLYYGISNPYSFYNSTDFDIGDYYLDSNPSGYISSYTDTNASTECSGGEYLDGSGICITFNSTVQDLSINQTELDNPTIARTNKDNTFTRNTRF